ncbi:hypothetical protein PPG32_11830 [Lautropia mirabilis]|uniref:hypothetical protein n=1 Tax=Lautropia mirabilis TaxID=47671 RepID=UPI0023498EBC|nr:hypothetical protein [Lautropia mirabilis]MDC6094787.1 hypothetical protein [Lautropia mirabilis]
MRKWLAFSIVSILLLSILQSGHGFLDSLLMLLFFLIFDGNGHIVVGLLVLALLVVRDVRARRARVLAGKQLVEVIRQRTAAMEARIALLEGRAPEGRASDVREEGGKDGNQTVRSAEEGVAKGGAMAGGFGTAGAGSSPGKAGSDQARENEGAAPRGVGGRVKPEDVAGDGGRGWRVLFLDLAKMVVFVSFLALLWAGSAYLFACGEPKLGRLEVSFQKCEMHR